MTALASRPMWKLAAFSTFVVGSLASIFTINRRVRDREAALTDSSNVALRDALRRLAAGRDALAMTMGPDTRNERQLRHVNASIIGPIDVLVLGQSDADHMSQTSFADGVRFYNGFISNSYFTYQYEVFDDIVTASGAPRVVLLDLRSGYMLSDGDEPPFDAPANDPRWWAGAPYRLGLAALTPWYRDVDSLLSLQQTMLSIEALWAQHLARGAAPHAGEPDVDTGAPFLDVAAHAKSGVHRWLADGSRVYPGEVDGVLVPRGQGRVEEARGPRRVNTARLPILESMLRKLQSTGTEVVAYSPPLQPRVFEDPTQAPLVLGAESVLREASARAGVDYCGLGTEARRVGCDPQDFYDELHVSRHCDARVLHELATGCTPRVRKLLHGLLSQSTLAD